MVAPIMHVVSRRLQGTGALRSRGVAAGFPPLPSPSPDVLAAGWHAGCPLSRRRRQEPATTSSSRAKEKAMNFEIEFEEVQEKKRSLGLVVACALALVGCVCLWRSLT
jgi:hypothetical protein